LGGVVGTVVPNTATDTNRANTTVSFPVVQFNAVKKQFVATCKVPTPVLDQSVKMLCGTTQSKLVELKKRTSNFLEKEN
jgi:hypothetical protein